MISEDQQQLAKRLRQLDRKVCQGNDPECTVFVDRGRQTVRRVAARRSGGESPGSPPAAASCLCEVGTLTSPTSTGVQTISHSLGEAPKAIIIFGTQQTADGITTDLLFSMGMGTSPTNRAAITSNYTNGGPTFSEDRYHTNAAVVAALNVGGTLVEVADIDEFTASNFKLDWTTASATAFQYHYLLLAGEGLEANVVEHLAPTADDTQVDVAHGLSDTPTAIIGMSNYTITSPPGQDGAAETGIGVGASDLTTDRWAGTYSAATQGGTRAQKAKFLAHSQAVTIVEEAVVDSADGTNVTLDWELADTAETYFLLMLRGCQAKVGTYTSPATAATRVIDTGLPSVSAFLTWAAMKTAGTAVVNDAKLTVGVSDGTNDAAAGYLHDSGDTNADRFSNDGAVLQVVDFAGSVLERATADFDGSNVEVVFDAAEAAVNEFNYLAIA